MKVDKAVCTKDTQKDLNKTSIQYETVFTTLVENKILAIKRECEGKKKTKKHKQGKTFGKFFFGRRIFGERKDDENIVEEQKDCSADIVIDIEKDEIINAATVDNQRSIIDMRGEDISRITSIQHNATETIIEERKIQKSEIDSDDETSVTVHKIPRTIRSSLKDDSNGSNGNGSLDEKGVRNMVVEVITHRQGQSYDESNGYENNSENKNKISEMNENEQHIDSSSLGSIRIDESTNADDSLTSVKDSVESISFPSSYCTISAGLATVSNEREASRLRVLEAKSISAQCSPILSRQSKPPPSCSAQTQTYHPKLLKSQVSYSDNHRGNYDYHSRDALRFFSRQNTSEDSVNLTVSTLLHEADSINALGERKSKSTSLLIIADKENKKAINRLDSSSIVSNQSNPLVRGFISSLNQLTTTSNYIPVITTTLTALRSKASVSKSTVVDSLPTKSILSAVTTTPITTTIMSTTTSTTTKASTAVAAAAVTATATTISSCDTAKLQRMTSTSTGSSVAPTGCCNTKAFTKEKDKRQKPLWQTRQSGSDDEYRKRKRKYKRYHRCSDPVLVYPSTGELQHCILSMPPNQPIQFYYNDDFLYDMALQVEADQNGDLQAIVPSHRSKRHTHHRHKKRNRHNKPKILVHDLDTQSVKVIDPDDLPQRARWTIIATACLLLLMCLMLVGITLRMAPIIDDMAFE